MGLLRKRYIAKVRTCQIYRSRLSAVTNVTFSHNHVISRDLLYVQSPDTHNMLLQIGTGHHNSILALNACTQDSL